MTRKQNEPTVKSAKILCVVAVALLSGCGDWDSMPPEKINAAIQACESQHLVAIPETLYGVCGGRVIAVHCTAAEWAKRYDCNRNDP